MTLFTIEKITEKAPHRPATTAYHPQRFQPYHPYPTLSSDAKFPSFHGDLAHHRVPGLMDGRDGLNSTGGSPSSPDGLSNVSSSPEPEPTSSVKSEEKQKAKSDKDSKPAHSYIALIAMAILASKEKRLLLCDIYQFIQENFPYYRNNDRSWRNSIRHNLSLNECFIKYGRSGDGRGNFWAIHPANVDDFSRGDFHRRRARRRVRASDIMAHGYSIYHPYSTPSYPVAPLGFVPMTVTTLPSYPHPGAPSMYPASSSLYPAVAPMSYPVSAQPTPSSTPSRVSTSPLSVHIDRPSPPQLSVLPPRDLSPTYDAVRLSPPSYHLPLPGYPFSPVQYGPPTSSVTTPLSGFPPTTLGLTYPAGYCYPTMTSAATTSFGSYHSNTSSMR
ncbi:uncharacterized protein [Asterias amurensis]|uniref:uncharacterized protein n=1 Tax=Asterias amurensis TaxID=7602 RepID=UPI003AB4A139